MPILSDLANVFLSRMMPVVDPSPQIQTIFPTTQETRIDNYNPVRLDCGPTGCGPSFGGGGWISTPKEIADSVPGLTKDQIDFLLNKPLLYRVASLLVDDCLRKLPQLVGEEQDLTCVIRYLEQLDFFTEAACAMFYARAYGGGALLLFVEDGKRNDEELVLEDVRKIRGFYALPKWYCTPLDNGSGRIDRGWYGQRIGRPEMYSVVPLSVSASASADGIQKNLADGGNRWHRSRIIPWQYRKEMDLIQARRWPEYNGWGPGVIEAVLPAYINRENGILRTADIVQGSHYNVLTLANAVQAASTPSGGAALQATINGIKGCMNATGNFLPLVGIPDGASLEPKVHNLSGLSDVTDSQRGFFLDVTEYPEVVLFTSGGGSGLQDSAAKGQWQAYHALVASTQENWVWKGGRLGGGILQAVKLAMADPNGPTQGEVKEIKEVIWPALEVASEKDRAEAALKNAQRRTLDSVILGASGSAMATIDPTVKETYPGLDTDDEIMPTFQNGLMEGSNPADFQGATTPASAIKIVGEEQANDSEDIPTQDALTPVAPALPLVLPEDIETEKQIAAALKMSTVAFRRWVSLTPGITTYPTPKGTRGGNRYSLSEILKAWKDASTMSRQDSVAVGLEAAWEALHNKNNGRNKFVRVAPKIEATVKQSREEADAWLDARAGNSADEIIREAKQLWLRSTNVRADSRQLSRCSDAVRISEKLLTLHESSWNLGTARNAVMAAKVIGKLLKMQQMPSRDYSLLQWGYNIQG